ncbi:PAS domain-containing protein [Geomobilimonas luticola]|uniref:histidine kinase n=1 Tax=Geomobilimonas luticola TaxID=1114878 RepID=A0ABS5SGB0_9BACT|nr:PAS domain-containing protein [Geomobilimonas luticola]MBT0654400.1 PAS domain-containing protein [Geomobilimonas luticola]
MRGAREKNEGAIAGEAVYRAIGESIDYGVWVCAPDGRNTYASESFLALVGMTQEQCSSFGWGDVLHPDDAEKTVAAWKECVRTGGTWDMEHRYRGVDGEYHDILARGVAVKDERGKVLCWAGINLDISSFKHVQKELLKSNLRLDLLSRTARRLLESEAPQAIVESLCQEVMTFLECDAFFNFLADDARQCLHLNACAGIPEESRAGIEWLDYGVAVCGCAARDACRIVAEDIQQTADPRTELVKSFGIRAYACHPLMAQGRVLGTLSFGTRCRDSFSDDDLALMRAVADLVAIAMERKRTTAEIERLATFPQLNPNPVIELDMAGRVTFCNRAAQEIVDSIGGGDVDVLLPRDMKEILASIDTGGEVHQWIREQEIDNLAYQVNVYHASQFQAVRLYINDITALKLTQERLVRTNEELEKRVASRTADLIQTIERIQQESAERLKAENELRQSKQRYILAVQGANDGIWDWDIEHDSAFISPRWKSMLGYGDNELTDIVREWKELIHPDDFQRSIDTVNAYLAGNTKDYQQEYRLRHKDGSYRWILTRGTCVRGAEGKPTRMAGSHTDITERKADEERLNRLNRIHAVLSGTGLAIVRATDQDTLFRDTCRIAVENGKFLLAWVSLLDVATGDVAVVAFHGPAGYLDGIRITARDEPEGQGPTGTVIREGKSCICNDFAHDPRTAPWHDWARTHGVKASAATPIRLEGAVIGALTLYSVERDFFDIDMIKLLEQMSANVSFALDNLNMTARRREAETSLQNETLERLRAIEELRAKERIMIQQGRQAAMGEMIGNIAHQWRQPLNTLALIIQQMKYYYELGEFNKQFLEDSTQKSMTLIKHMSHTIEDFRDFFKPDKEKSPFRINNAINQSVALIDANFKSQFIGLEVDTSGDPVVNGYSNEFSQAILNILVNARDVLLERSVANGQVRITSRMEDGNIVVAISDNGGGIPEDIMEKIFDPYFTTKGPDKGTGIGLYMAKTIIERNMGGRLTAFNAQGGAMFRIEVHHGDN